MTGDLRGERFGENLHPPSANSERTLVNDTLNTVNLTRRWRESHDAQRLIEPRHVLHLYVLSPIDVST